MMTIYSSVLFVSLILNTALFSGPYTGNRVLQAPENKVSFTITNAGFPVDGSMSNVKSEISFDPLNLKASSIKATVDPSTIDTRIGIRNKHLKRTDYFDVEKFPTILMQSKSLKSVGQNRFEGHFDLTIKAITKDLLIPFRLVKTTSGSVLLAQFKINRLDYALGEKSIILSEDVLIDVQLVVK